MASTGWWCHDCGKQDLYWCNDCVAMTGRPRRAMPSAHAAPKFEKGGSAGRSARPAPCRLRAVPRAVRQWPQATSSKLSTSFSLMLHTLSKSDTCWAGARAWLSLGWVPRGGVCCSDGRSAQWVALGTMPPCPGRSALCTGRCLEHPGMACCSAGRRAFGRCARRFLVLAQRVAALLAMFCVESRSPALHAGPPRFGWGCERAVA